MPDITLCCNRDCPMRTKCYRYLARPDEYAQSFALFQSKYKTNEQGHRIWTCDHFWEADIRRKDTLPLSVVDNRYDRDEKWKDLK